jgi:menaquinone reductase, multiheme cytochrome c subunit
MNRVRLVPPAMLVVVLLYVGGIFAAGASPWTTDVGYAPQQPVAYSHALHAGKLGLDCRYCHNTVERTAAAAIPPTQTCMNCHTRIRAEGVKLAIVRDSAKSGLPIHWVRVHDLPDYVYFNHSAHVTRGVPCASCHGRVDQMDVITQVQPLSMGWCLDCHRAPEKHLRPVKDVTRMDWALTPEQQLEVGRAMVKDLGIKPSTDCSTCHR